MFDLAGNCFLQGDDVLPNVNTPTAWFGSRPPLDWMYVCILSFNDACYRKIAPEPMFSEAPHLRPMLFTVPVCQYLTQKLF